MQTKKYHYTNYEGLKGVLESRTLWMTQSVFVNDFSEITYALDAIEKTVYQKLSTNKNNKVNLEAWKAAMCEYKKVFSEKINFYICAFCLKQDYLPAWRWYANDGDGFAIGFNEFFFEQKEPEIVERSLSCCKVAYFEEDVRPWIDEILNSSISNINDQIIKLLVLAPKIKHSAYKEEEEFRIYEIEYPTEYFPEALPIPKYYGKTPKLHTVFEFNSDAISEIWIGPKGRKEHENVVKEILKQNGYNTSNIKIHRSEIPYRS